MLIFPASLTIRETSQTGAFPVKRQLGRACSRTHHPFLLSLVPCPFPLCLVPLHVELLGFLFHCSWGPTPARARSALRASRGPQALAGNLRKPRSLHVELLGFLRSIHDEPEPRRRIYPHQLVDHAVGNDVVEDLDAQQAA